MPYIMIDVILIYDSFGGPLQLGIVLVQNIFLAVNPFHCFFAKSWWAGKKYLTIKQQ